MGGDDLGSDDEYLLDSRQFHDPIDSDNDDDDEDAGRANIGSSALGAVSLPPSGRISGGGTKKKDKKKRRHHKEDDHVSGVPPPPSSTADSKSKKKRRKKNRKGGEDGSSLTGKELLIEAGRTISMRPADVQAAFLSTCYSHALGIIRGAGDGDKDVDGKNVTEDEEKFLLPSSFLVRSDASGGGGGDAADVHMASFIRSNVSSAKRLKNWKSPGTYSPMVLVICISARRSVAVLKALSPLKVRCAKLFAKHMDFDEQVNMLKGGGSSVGAVAVGTPNRLLKLGEAGALSLDRTELVMIDCKPDSKGFTVCTLNDTAPDLMRFIRSYVGPRMGTSKHTKARGGVGGGVAQEIKLAMY